MHPSGQTTEEILAHVLGAGAAAGEFLTLLAGGRFDEAWPLADPEWRLGRVQAWLWNNRVAFTGLDLNTEAERGTAADAPSSGLAWWPEFAASEAAGWAEAFEGFDATEAGPWGCVGRPRPVSLDYEEAVFADMGGKVGLVQPGTAAMMITVLLHVVDAGWLVAAVGGLRYRPGWPPTFSDGSPVCGGS